MAETTTNAFGFIQYPVDSIFIDPNHAGNVAHRVMRVDQDPLPTDEDAPSYEAYCGLWGFGYGMGDIGMAQFVPSVEALVERQASLCPICFPQRIQPAPDAGAVAPEERGDEHSCDNFHYPPYD